MKCKFNGNLGVQDAEQCQSQGCSVDVAKCRCDEVVDIPEAAYALLSAKYPGLCEPIKDVRGIAKEPELKAVPEPAAKPEQPKQQAAQPQHSQQSKGK